MPCYIITLKLFTFVKYNVNDKVFFKEIIYKILKFSGTGPKVKTKDSMLGFDSSDGKAENPR